MKNTHFNLGNEDHTDFSVNLDKIFNYQVSVTEPGLQRKGTIDTRSMIGSRFQKNYKDISIGFNQSAGDFTKAKNFAEAKQNHETYRILLKIYQNLKSKIN